MGRKLYTAVHANAGSLLEAVHQEDVEKVAMLIKEGANVEEKDKYGNTPLGLAVELGNLEIANMLLQEGAYPELGSWTTPLEVACINGDLEIVRLLIKCGADVNARLDKDSTAINSAALRGHFDVVKCLVVSGADVNLKSRKAEFPLLASAHSGNEHLFQYLYNLTSPELRKLALERMKDK